MNDAREFEGKDLEQALRLASSTLGIAEPELDYEILEQGRKGLFGIGAKSVRIRIMPPVKPLVHEPPPARRDAEDRNRNKNKKEPVAEPSASSERQRPKRSRRGRRSRRSQSDAPEDRKDERRPRKKARPPRDEPDEPKRPVNPEASLESIQETVSKMFELLALNVDVRAVVADSGTGVEVSGPHADRLTQKDGELMNAVQFLLNRMARRTWPEAGRIRLACDGMSKRRDDDLVELTREVAQQVSRTGKAKRLHPMNAYERRLVHLTAREFGGVGSRSEGNGSMKAVRIFKQGAADTQPDADPPEAALD